MTASLLAEAASASADIDGLLEKIRAPAGALAAVMGDGAARVEADFDRMRALVTEAPLGEDWEAAADPKGEIVASRDVAAEQEDASSATATPEDADQPPQDTEAWSHEEAMSAEGDSEVEPSGAESSVPGPRPNVAG